MTVVYFIHLTEILELKHNSDIPISLQYFAQADKCADIYFVTIQQLTTSRYKSCIILQTVSLCFMREVERYGMTYSFVFLSPPKLIG